MRVLPKVVKHLTEVSTLIMDGINEHVPMSERAIDVNTIKPLNGLDRRGAQPSDPAATGAGPIPRDPVETQDPHRISGAAEPDPAARPAHEPTPEFADRWFARFDRGDDVAHWYAGSG